MEQLRQANEWDPLRVDAFGDQMKADAQEALYLRDWHRAYEAAKAWISGGGGAEFVDPWLIYAASGLIHGQPRIAVHSLDLGLGHWVEHPADRSILHTVRGCIIIESLRDPRVAGVDFRAASESAPEWLRSIVDRGLERSRVEGPLSRKRKPSVSAAPTIVQRSTAPVMRGTKTRIPGSVPDVWPAVASHLPLLDV